MGNDHGWRDGPFTVTSRLRPDGSAPGAAAGVTFGIGDLGGQEARGGRDWLANAQGFAVPSARVRRSQIVTESRQDPPGEAGRELTPGEDADRRAELLTRWRDDLAAWAIPEHITAAVTESPWVLPGQVFARRADAYAAKPAGPSFDRAWAALDPPGSVLDIGCGAGAACLPLLPRATALTVVDADERMLGLLAERAAARGVGAAAVAGRWPQVAPQVPVADVVTCHHVLYNVAEIEPFVVALTGHARRLVVVETTATHPLTSLNELWLRFHGIVRPQRPTADDVLAILGSLGMRASYEVWRRPGGPDYASFAELVDVTRRRLCLPPDRAEELAGALVEAGVDPEHPQDLGSSGRDVYTIWWNGNAARN